MAKAALISAVPPLMVKTAANPGGLPKEVFDGFQAQLAANRAQFYYDVPAGPFYGYNRPGAKPSQGVIWNWWRQGMMGGAKAHYDGIVAFSQTDFNDDLKKITVPAFVTHGDDDQIVPSADSMRRWRPRKFPTTSPAPYMRPARHPEQVGPRSGKLWMVSHPVDVGDGGVMPLLSSWGGEAVYFWLQVATIAFPAR